MTQENSSREPEPTTLRPPIATTDDRRDCCLEGTGHALLVNIMRIGQHWVRARLPR
jgi:hypothetical protein